MASDDFFDGALDEFEALTSTTTASSQANNATQGKPENHPPAEEAASTSAPAPIPTTTTSKAPTFDPLRKGPKRTRAAAAAPLPAEESTAVSSGPPLPPELQQLADDLAKLISESTLEDAQPSTSGTATRSPPPTKPAPGTRSAGTFASLKALEELTQQSVAAQGALPGAGQGGGLFGGMLPNLEGMGMGEPHMNTIVDSIMQHLLSKDVLYQPMKDIRNCYPPWLESNKAVVPAADMERYVKQYGYIQEICKLYEEEPNNYTQLVALMQQMQACGDPPEDIVKEMSAGLDHAPPEGGNLDQGDMPPLNDLDLQQLQSEINKCPVQ